MYKFFQVFNLTNQKLPCGQLFQYKGCGDAEKGPKKGWCGKTAGLVTYQSFFADQISATFLATFDKGVIARLKEKSKQP